MQMAYIDSLQNPRPRTPQKKQDEKPKEKGYRSCKSEKIPQKYILIL